MHNKKLNLFLLIFATVFFPRLFCSQKLQPVLERKTYTADGSLNIEKSAYGLSYNLKSKYYTYWNQSHFSTFGFNQEKPVDIKNGHFLDMEIRDFLPQKAFISVNMAKLKLYLFPFDSNNQVTVNTQDAKIECTLTDDEKLKIIRTTPKNEPMHFEYKDPFITLVGYFSWTKTCVTLCQVEEEKTIDFTNGYMLDHAKIFFLPDNLWQKAYNSCFLLNCPKKNSAHFHDNFPSLFVLPFDKDGVASFIDSHNRLVMLTVIYPALETIEKVQNQNLLEGKDETIEQVDPQKPIISDDTKNVVEPEKKQDPEPKVSPSPKKISNIPEIEPRKMVVDNNNSTQNPKQEPSFFSKYRWKVVCVSLVGLWLITMAIKKRFCFL
jgi:hypothetical protein